MHLQKNTGSLSDDVPVLAGESLLLLKKLISTPSFGGREEETAEIIQAHLRKEHIKPYRTHYNIWALNKYYDKNKPTILLNSHHDTAKPNWAYSRNPYFPQIEDGKLYGLGSNEAGGSLVALLALFRYFYARPDLPYNLCFTATEGEEKSGPGIKGIQAKIGNIAFAVIGAPTQMQMWGMDSTHPIVCAGLAIGLKTCSAPVNSSRGWLDAPSLIIGPGNPARSNIANEYIFVDEISEGISVYIELLNSLLFCLIHNPEHNFDEF